jgi:hypothetical protein
MACIVSSVNEAFTEKGTALGELGAASFERGVMGPSVALGELGAASFERGATGPNVALGEPGAAPSDTSLGPGFELGTPDRELRRRRFAAAKSEECGSAEGGEGRDARCSDGPVGNGPADRCGAGSPMFSSGTAPIGVQSAIVSRQTSVAPSIRPARQAASMSA